MSDLRRLVGKTATREDIRAWEKTLNDTYLPVVYADNFKPFVKKMREHTSPKIASLACGMDLRGRFSCNEMYEFLSFVVLVEAGYNVSDMLDRLIKPHHNFQHHYVSKLLDEVDEVDRGYSYGIAKHFTILCACAILQPELPSYFEE